MTISTHSPVEPNLLLAVDGVTVDFDGFKALNGFTLTLDRGTLRVLIGPNGAGKSTLCDTIIGRVRATDGQIYFKGEDITELAEHEIVQRGICRKFQTPGVLPSLSVMDNLLIAAQKDRRWWHSFGSSQPAEEHDRVDEVLETIGLADRRHARAGDLAHGEKQWLEIGMVVATDAELLLLDEPTAGMGPQETSRTAKLIRSLLGRHAVLVIDHDMSFVEQLDGRVTVMHQGQFLKEGSVAEIRRDPEVAAVYLGRAAEESASSSTTVPGHSIAAEEGSSQEGAGEIETPAMDQSARQQEMEVAGYKSSPDTDLPAIAKTAEPSPQNGAGQQEADDDNFAET